MIIQIKQKQEPKIGTIRVINRYAFLPAKIEIANGVWGWVWLERWEERQRWEYSVNYYGGDSGWRTIAKTLKTK